jgi:hypothetical protein
VSETQEVPKFVGLSPRVLVLLVVLIALAIPKTIMTYWAGGQEEGAWGGTGTEWGFLPLSIFFIVAIIMSMLGDKAFTKGEMALFTGLAAFASVLVGHPYLPGIANMAVMLANLPAYSDVLPMIPDFWVIKDRTIVSGAWTGGTSVPAAVAPYMIFEMLYLIISGGIMICLSSIFQRKFIYEDRLPFPSVAPSVVAVDMYAQKVDGSRALFKNKWIWLGFLFGAIYVGPMTINMFYPLIPREHVFGRIPLDVQLAPIFAPYHIEGWWFIDPMTIVWYTIMPTDVLASIFVFDLIVFWIYPALATLGGAMAPGISAWSYYWGDVEGGIAWMQMEMGGTCIGVALWVLFAARKHIASSLQRAIKGGTSPYPDDISDKMLWSTFGALWLLWLIIWLASGANLAVLIFTILLWTLTIIGNMWIQSHNLEWLAAPFSWWTSHQAVFGFGEMVGAYSNPSRSLAALTARGMPQALTLSNANWSGALPVLYAYKLAETGGVKPKTVFYGLFIITIATAVIGVPIVNLMLFKYGASSILTGAAGGGGDINPPFAMAANAGAGVLAKFGYWSPFQWMWAGIGIIFPIVLFVLRSKFTWFFLHPAALLIWPICYGIFRSLPALIIKLGVLKVGGAKLYENVWIKIVTGFMLGVMVLDIIAMYALAFKYF